MTHGDGCVIHELILNDLLLTYLLDGTRKGIGTRHPSTLIKGVKRLFLSRVTPDRRTDTRVSFSPHLRSQLEFGELRVGPKKGSKSPPTSGSLWGGSGVGRSRSVVVSWS